VKSHPPQPALPCPLPLLNQRPPLLSCVRDFPLPFLRRSICGVLSVLRKILIWRLPSTLFTFSPGLPHAQRGTSFLFRSSAAYNRPPILGLQDWRCFIACRFSSQGEEATISTSSLLPRVFRSPPRFSPRQRRSRGARDDRLQVPSTPLCFCPRKHPLVRCFSPPFSYPAAAFSEAGSAAFLKRL